MSAAWVLQVARRGTRRRARGPAPEVDPSGQPLSSSWPAAATPTGHALKPYSPWGQGVCTRAALCRRQARLCVQSRRARSRVRAGQLIQQPNHRLHAMLLHGICTVFYIGCARPVQGGFHAHERMWPASRSERAFARSLRVHPPCAGTTLMPTSLPQQMRAGRPVRTMRRSPGRSWLLRSSSRRQRRTPT
jgi:hypothetical protein